MGVNAVLTHQHSPLARTAGAWTCAHAGAAYNIRKSGCKGVKAALGDEHSPLAEGQRPKIPVDDAQQLLGPGQAQGHVTTVKVLHVVAALQVLIHPALACSARGPGDQPIRPSICDRVCCRLLSPCLLIQKFKLVPC